MTVDPRIRAAEAALQAAEMEMDAVGQLQANLITQTADIDSRLADARARRTALIQQVAHEGADVDLTGVRNELTSLEAESAEVADVMVALNTRRNTISSAHMSATQALNQARADVAREEAEGLRAELNSIGRQYEAKWAELADKLTEVGNHGSIAPYWIDDARNEVKNIAFSFPGTARYIRLPVVGEHGRM